MNVTVRNDGHNPVECAGHIWLPRRSTTADVAEERLDAIVSHRRLTLESTAQGYRQMKVAKLRELLGARDLPTSGKKAELVARLEAADQDDGEDGSDDSEE